MTTIDAVKHPAQEFLERHCPQWAAQFQFEACDTGWEAAACGGIVIRGASPLAQAVGLRHFLEEYAGLCLSYAGMQQRVTFTQRGKKLPLPFAPMRGTLPEHTRSCFRARTFTCSPCWWDWERWQDEVDILAMYGVNEALLLLGSEFAWFQALREEDISGDYILNAMSAPPFWPRQLQGRFDSILPPVDPLFLKSRGQLGAAIAQRMHAWGMVPVLPEFSGAVSSQLRGLLKGARLLPQPSWHGFRTVYQMDPNCAAYQRLKENYKAQQALIFGEGTYRYWHPQDSPEDADVLEESHLFPPEGRTVLHGDANAAAQRTQAEAFRADEPESNPLLYTLHMESLTRSEPEDLDAWLKRYAKRRYGTEQAEGYEALRLLCDTVYAQKGAAPGSVFCMRPVLQPEPAGPGDALQAGYDSAPLLRCVNLLLAVESRQPGWRYDLCDILRQALSAKARKSYLQAMEGFRARDSRSFERGANDFLALLEECDRLLRCEEAFCLRCHLARAGGSAKIDAEKNNFELALLLQHSLYGAGGVKKEQGYQLHGMAWREWGGLLGSLHGKRWRWFFMQLASHFGDKRFSLETKQKPLGRIQYAGNKFYDRMSAIDMDWLRNYNPAGEEPPEDLVETVKDICRKYAHDEN